MRLGEGKNWEEIQRENSYFHGKIIGNHREISYKCLFSLGNHGKIRAINVKIGENHGENGMFTKLELKHTFVDYTGM